MSEGFFPSSLLKTAAPASLLPKCGACGLYQTCKTPKMVPHGKGERKILIVGEAPGQQEDIKGLQFVGKAGQRLQDSLRRLRVDIRRDCWTTNALICRPPDNKIADPKAVDYCRPNLLRTMAELKPVVVILLGKSATTSLIADAWKEKIGELSKWVGWNIPSHKYNAWICPTYHPSYVLREENEVLDLIFERHLGAAVAHEARPWTEVPDWGKDIDIVLDPKEAARILLEMERRGGLIAYDEEGTCLKPEYEGGETVSASACWQGEWTISYPWLGEAIDATRALLHSDNCRFIASNMKHEERWVRRRWGRPVRHWAWDTMLAGHVLDNREGVTGLKFQSFVYLGFPAYDEHIKQFLRGYKGSKINRVKTEIDLTQLLKYGGFDTLLEFKLAQHQSQRLGLPL